MNPQHPSDYPLGYSAEEHGRLERQGDFLGGLTADFLRRAGLKPGMSVLEVGCGAGDVSLIAARIVGPEGRLVGVDRDAASLERARTRVAAAQLGNVSFRQAELPHIGDTGLFDALIGRLVMIYFAEPAAALRTLLAQVHPGGLVAFHEPDLSRATTVPPNVTLVDSVALVTTTFERCGFHPRIGVSLDRVFRDAGLRPSLIGQTPMEGGGDGFCPAWLASTVRSLMPAMIKFNLATARDIDIDTLEDRIRAEARASGSVILGPLMVGAWATCAQGA